MKAMVIRDLGGPEVFKESEMPRPKPGPTELLVKVYAASVNPVDISIRKAGSRAGIKPPAIIGYDVSGIVKVTFMFPQRDRYQLDIFRQLLEREQIRSVIDSALPLSDLAEAHRRLEADHVKGKIVLRVREE